MAISRKEIEHIASLARLDSSEGIFDRLAIDTERKNAFHEDAVIQEYTPDELIEPNAPDFQAGGVAVPRVVE